MEDITNGNKAFVKATEDSVIYRDGDQLYFYPTPSIEHIKLECVISNKGYTFPGCVINEILGMKEKHLYPIDYSKITRNVVEGK